MLHDSTSSLARVARLCRLLHYSIVLVAHPPSRGLLALALSFPLSLAVTSLDRDVDRGRPDHDTLAEYLVL
jgi:hypothetical protein